jgi:hypothetical protein
MRCNRRFVWREVIIHGDLYFSSILSFAEGGDTGLVLATKYDIPTLTDLIPSPGVNSDLPSVGELFPADLLYFGTAGVSKADFLFDEPLTCGVFGVTPSSLVYA